MAVQARPMAARWSRRGHAVDRRQKASQAGPLSALCSRWLTMRHMGEDAVLTLQAKRRLQLDGAQGDFTPKSPVLATTRIGA